MKLKDLIKNQILGFFHTLIILRRYSLKSYFLSSTFIDNFNLAKTKLLRIKKKVGYKYHFVTTLNNWESEPIKSFKKKKARVLIFKPGNFFEKIKLWKDFKEKKTQQLKTFIENDNRNYINIYFFYLSDFYINWKEIQKLKTNNRIFISFSWDDHLHFKSIYPQETGIFKMSLCMDFVFTMSYQNIDKYYFNYIPCFFLNGSPKKAIFNPKSYWKVKSNINKFIFFYGNKYSIRENIINFLKVRFKNIKCLGNGWVNRNITFDEIKENIQKSMVTIGISNVGYAKNSFNVKGRDFEVLENKGLLLTNYSEDLTTIFTINRDLIVYKNLKDLENQINKILTKPEIYNSIRYNGYMVSHHYSWDSRLNYINNLVELILDGK